MLFIPNPPHKQTAGAKRNLSPGWETWQRPREGSLNINKDQNKWFVGKIPHRLPAECPDTVNHSYCQYIYIYIYIYIYNHAYIQYINHIASVLSPSSFAPGLGISNSTHTVLVCLQKISMMPKFWTDKQSVTFWTITMTLNPAIPFLYKTLQLMMLDLIQPSRLTGRYELNFLDDDAPSN